MLCVRVCVCGMCCVCVWYVCLCGVCVVCVVCVFVFGWCVGGFARTREASLNGAVALLSYITIIIMYFYHALINALSAHMIHINLNMIFYTHAEHSPNKTIYIKYYIYKKKIYKKIRTTNTHTHTHTHAHTHAHWLYQGSIISRVRTVFSCLSVFGAKWAAKFKALDISEKLIVLLRSLKVCEFLLSSERKVIT